MTYTLSYPIEVGSRKNYTPTQLAERAIECVTQLPARFRGKGPRLSYALMIGPDGKATIDRPDNANVQEWVATIDRTSCPDWLADEIREVLP